MIRTRRLQKEVAQVRKLWAVLHYDWAIANVDELCKECPCNSQLLVMWACLAQLQDDPGSSLNEVKRSLQQAIEFDSKSVDALLEMGNLLDSVDDSPSVAAKMFADAADLARRQLVDALVGSAKSLLQINPHSEAIDFLIEALQFRSRPSCCSMDDRTGKFP